MRTLIEHHREEIERLCRKFRVLRLELFGSASTGEFNDQSSDLDFLVSFGKLESGQYADSYFGLQEALVELFHRRVDLVVDSAITNPYFLAAIEPTRALVYAA
jgi:Predicted nucleotidyltransferases